MAAPTTGVACPAFPWPQDPSQRGPKVFMQSDCAACHSMLPYASLRGAAPEMVAHTAEIVVAAPAEAAHQAAEATPLYGGAPDLATLATKIQDGSRCKCNLYSTSGGTIAAAAPRMLAEGAAVCQELRRKMAPPSSVWTQFAQPYLKTFQAA